MTSGRGAWTGAVVAMVAAGIGMGVPAGHNSPGGDRAQTVALLDPSCVVPPGDAAGAKPWHRGLIARGDSLNRYHRLGRYAEGGACADLPQWFVALALRSDALNADAGVGRHRRGGRG